MAIGRINTQLGVCDRYVRSEAGAPIKKKKKTSSFLHNIYTRLTLVIHLTIEELKWDILVIYTLSLIQPVGNTLTTLDLCIHRYPEMSGVLNYRLRGRRPQGFFIFLSVFFEEQERNGFLAIHQVNCFSSFHFILVLYFYVCFF